MIDGLIGGRICGNPVRRTGKNGNPFVTAKVRVSTAGGEAMFVNVIAFVDAAAIALLALSDGGSVALSGELTPKVWTDKAGASRPALDMVAHAVLTEYHVNRKRQAVREEMA